MKIIIAGGSGQLGQLLERSFRSEGHDLWILSRNEDRAKNRLAWDGKNLGPWAKEVDGSDVVINLAGRTVNCRYSDENLKQMMDSRVDSTRVVGQAIAQAKKPPGLWLQMSTATIYAHRLDAANDEATGVLGGEEDRVPSLWKRSVEIAKAWEKELEDSNTPSTRKIALRTSVVMSPDEGGIFDVLRGLVKKGLGGKNGSGEQYVSWIHGEDFVSAIRFLIEHEELSGPINVCGPNPLPNKDFMRAIREALGVGIGLPATEWMLEVGAFFMRTETELLLKSRRVIPQRLLDAGFVFAHPTWPEAAKNLEKRNAQ